MNGMGEFVDTTATGLPFGFIGTAVSALALGIFAITQNDGENDDDDSSPGGGLMQPTI